MWFFSLALLSTDLSFTRTTEVQRLQKSACCSVLKSKAITNSFKNKPKIFIYKRAFEPALTHWLMTRGQQQCLWSISDTDLKHSETYASKFHCSPNRNAALALLSLWFCAVVISGRLTTKCGHITIGCGFPSSKGASLSKVRTGIFSCLNLKRSSAKFVLPEETEMQEVTSLQSLSHIVLPRSTTYVWARHSSFETEAPRGNPWIFNFLKY